MDWFRVYHDIIDDPKVLALPRANRWDVLALFAVSSRQTARGTLPSIAEIASHLRIRVSEASRTIRVLVDAGFIDVSPDGKTLRIHGWEKRQFKSDDVSKRTERWRERSGERSKNVYTNGARTEAEQRQNRAEGEYPPREPPAAFVPPSPESIQVGQLAITITGDSSWGPWVTQQVALGHSPGDVEGAIRESSGVGKLTKPYTAKILQRWKLEGRPDQSRGSCSGSNGPPKPKPITMGDLPPEEQARLEARSARNLQLPKGLK